MTNEVEVSDLIDKAIIESFKMAEKGKLMRKTIIGYVMGLVNEKESVIIKKIEKMSKEPNKYLIKVSRGIYQLNPEIRFTFIGESLPSESETKTLDISPKAREEHTEELKLAIANWIENFPKIPSFENCYEFNINVKKCELYPLFNDLSNHLQHSGYNICKIWDKIKTDVKENEKRKEELLKLIEKNFSDIYKLDLKFVSHSDNLKDFECSLAFLTYEYILLNRIDISEVSKKYPKVASEEEGQEKLGEINAYESSFNITKDRITKYTIIFEKEDSAIWGDYEDIIQVPCNKVLECIRVPKKYIDVLRRCRNQAISVFVESTPEIEASVNDIIKAIDQLDQDAVYLMNELHDSLHCKTFLGNCRYLGVI
jgi:hypothetical protein